ncbi:unnamed protein product [Ilex paraguariensis]|uniref:Uncharacterized protein n=1 Tax=Ilex paraguariensis TaxID=185542 RepID=A0ABC8R4G5_9AQUA
MSNFYKSMLFMFWAILLCSNEVLAKKSRIPISGFVSFWEILKDSEVREMKNQCYADIESGLWGRQCKSSTVAKENCALKCLSPGCYELIYESDPVRD